MAVKTHGLSKTPEYRAWINMVERCEYKAPGYEKHYSGRGITVCKEWRNSFPAFLAHVGTRPTPQHSLDRIDVNGNYEPGNVRWTTKTVQTRNTRRNHLVVLDGKKITLAEAAENARVPYNTVLYRLKRGWTIEQAVYLRQQKGFRP